MLIKLDLQFFSEKTEKATPRKKQDARKKGQVAKSTDLINAVVLLAAFFILLAYGKQSAARLYQLVRQSLSDGLLWDITEDSIPLLFVGLLQESVMIAVPIILITWIAALTASLAQVGFMITTEPMKFDLKKIDPIEGTKKIFSAKSVAELIKALLKVTVVGTVAGLLLWRDKGLILKLPEMEPLRIVSFLGSFTVKMGLTISAVYLVIGVADLVFQKFDHAKKLRMTKQEVKEEHKKIEGDPLIKSKIKEKQRQIARARMMQDVPNAQVVVTNPTHFAVAIAYEPGEMKVPMVVAKGADYMALKIREIAKEHQVVIMENKPLARTLYASVEIGQEIPEELFKAVAEVLAYVYRVKGSFSRKTGVR